MTGEAGDHDTEKRRSDRRGGVRDRIERVADRARSGFDEGIVDVLSWLQDTDTRTRIYVHLRKHPWSTPEEVAEGTGIYPSTVRAVLADLADEEAVERRERDTSSEYEYTTAPPSDLVGDAVDPVRESLENLTDVGESVRDEESERAVRIEVDTGSSAEAAVGEASADVETDLEGEAELDDEGPRIEGKGGGEIDVETNEGETTIEGEVDAEVGSEGVDVDVDANVETPDDESDGSSGSR